MDRNIENEQSEGVLRPVLNRPNRLNAFDGATATTLLSALQAADIAVGALLSARFSTRQDLCATLEMRFSPLIRAIAALAQPVVCVLQGAAGRAGDRALPTDAVQGATQLAGLPTQAMRPMKQAFDTRNTLDARLDLARDVQRVAGFTPDFAEGMAAFLAKRPASFTGSAG